MDGILPDFANLTHVDVDCYSEAFDCLLRNASTFQRLESLTNRNDTALKHSEFFAVFLRVTSNTLKELHLESYECSNQDFELMTSVCTKLQVLELDCDKVSLKNLRKIKAFQDLSDLNIGVLEERFCHEVFSACSKNVRKIKVSSGCDVVIDLIKISNEFCSNRENWPWL
jgi:hypothetical protein